MGIERGQRQTQRSKQAIIQALMALLREKGYQSITIEEIAVQANIGRSTFYRHFPAKADVLVEMHKMYFARIDFRFATSSHEPSNNPSPGLIRMLELFKQAGAPPISLTGLGGDGEYVLRQINQLLRQAIEAALRQVFVEEESTIPLPILAQSMTGIYLSLLRGAMEGQYPFAPTQLATTIHRLNQALLKEAVPKRA